MMKTRKLLFTSLALAMSISPVFAETYTGSDNWSVTFDGDSMDSNFKSSQITETVSGLQAGDDAYFEVSLKNAYSETTDWYMANEVLQTLEDSRSVASGAGYSYELTYYDPDGNSTLLYSSYDDQVGGEYVYTKDTEKVEGLKQATDSLKNYFYLDTLDSNDAGKVTLRIRFEGVTGKNAYQNTAAQVQLKFAVELTKSTSKKIHKSVDTSDTSNILMYSVIALVAGIACVGLVIYNVKSRKEEE